MKKNYRYIAKHQYFFLPLILLIVYILLVELKIFKVIVFENKVESVVSLAGVFVGVLLAIFTLYASIPKNNEVMRRVIQSGHHQIFKKSILFGCTFFILCILLWLFGFSTKWVVLLLLMGLADVVIAIRYISLINDYV
ncbi:hypothetical protein [Anaerotignum propionicum]|uniref:hypothetical protein n=1 Tax=Anaerotignum propionicum TaxID=28446 RepID=UPI0028965AFA|nr:hypothetical protein [Anaerotignum propionicum]